MSFVTLTTGTGFTVTVTGVKADGQLTPNHVMRTKPLPAFPVILPPIGFGMEAFPAIELPPKTPPM